MPEQTTLPRTAWIVVNPAARRAHRFDPGRALDLLAARGWAATVHAADDPDHFRSLAAAAVTENARLLAVVGGDGAVRTAAGVTAGTSTAVAVLPAGTANVWAKEIGVARDPLAALEQHLGGRILRVDLGRANGEPFLLMASLGWDADVVHTVNAATKRRLGELAYAARAAVTVPRLRPVHIEWEYDGAGRSDKVGLLVVSNTRLYGGRVRFSPQAEADDGLLEICALSPRRRGDGVRMAGRLVRGRLGGSPGVLTASARRVRIATPGIPYQLDGDPGGETPVTFEVEPDAVAVSIPAGPAPAIFGRVSREERRIPA